MKHRTKRTPLIVVVLLVLGSSAYWFFTRPEPEPEIPLNLPTAEELERIRAIEQSASQVAPGVPGIGVLPPGSSQLTSEDTEGEEAGDEDAEDTPRSSDTD